MTLIELEPPSTRPADQCGTAPFVDGSGSAR
jgi:hypothetical protein